MGTAKYRSIHGHVVDITEVTRDNKPVGNFDDFVYLGEVDELVEAFAPLDMSKEMYNKRAKALLEKMKEDSNPIKPPKLFRASFGSVYIAPASPFHNEHRWN